MPFPPIYVEPWEKGNFGNALSENQENTIKSVTY